MWIIISFDFQTFSLEQETNINSFTDGFGSSS